MNYYYLADIRGDRKRSVGETTNPYSRYSLRAYHTISELCMRAGTVYSHNVIWSKCDEDGRARQGQRGEEL